METAKAFENHPLKYAVEEFSLANSAYLRMVKIGVGNFAEYERAWREFLHRIERVWIKTQAAVYHMPNWKKIESGFIELRREDPLLQYLHQARNVEEHSIADVAKDWDPHLQVRQGKGIVELTWEVWDRSLLPVKNRGVVYNPPMSHLGQNIEHLKRKGKAELRVIAEFALRFYCDFLNKVSSEVVGRTDR
ncbi:MAG: hypothetical protein PHS12_06250 [Candidatus Omnitrophica bacterium]|jgi:hypothetical protein|nr:hypothetical protein [Candidatus Omnitrophota bacterium]MDD4982334.1 hypothetical protein [Candidatus Omnitrophota bacterium]